MFSDFIICIFSYNRADLLQNLLKSISAFYPDMHIAIFDDGSDDKQMLSLLEELKTRSTYIHRTYKSSLSSKHGGLYHNMNIALQFAVDRNYKYAYFVQDDMQFLWRDEALPQRVETIFYREECFMCNFNFLQKIFIRDIEKRLPNAGQALFVFERYGVADTGIIDVRKAQLAKLHFNNNSERDNGQYWHGKGYRLYWLPVCHIAWVPWPASFRFKKIENRSLHELEPLSEKSIERIKDNHSYAYLEDYTKIKAFGIPKPYWYTVNPGLVSLVKIYLKYYWGKVFRQP